MNEIEISSKLLKKKAVEKWDFKIYLLQSLLECVNCAVEFYILGLDLCSSTFSKPELYAYSIEQFRDHAVYKISFKLLRICEWRIKMNIFREKLFSTVSGVAQNAAVQHKKSWL